tara:strand:- start:671 stop:1822 length:1152 start_codon:yes stop_codon:yes gene_type:complete
MQPPTELIWMERALSQVTNLLQIRDESLRWGEQTHRNTESLSRAVMTAQDAVKRASGPVANRTEHEKPQTLVVVSDVHKQISELIVKADGGDEQCVTPRMQPSNIIGQQIDCENKSMTNVLNLLVDSGGAEWREHIKSGEKTKRPLFLWSGFKEKCFDAAVCMAEALHLRFDGADICTVEASLYPYYFLGKFGHWERQLPVIKDMIRGAMEQRKYSFDEATITALAQDVRKNTWDDLSVRYAKSVQSGYCVAIVPINKVDLQKTLWALELPNIAREVKIAFVTYDINDQTTLSIPKLQSMLREKLGQKAQLPKKKDDLQALCDQHEIMIKNENTFAIVKNPAKSDTTNNCWWERHEVPVAAQQISTRIHESELWSKWSAQFSS